MNIKLWVLKIQSIIKFQFSVWTVTEIHAQKSPLNLRCSVHLLVTGAEQLHVQLLFIINVAVKSSTQQKISIKFHDKLLHLNINRFGTKWSILWMEQSVRFKMCFSQNLWNYTLKIVLTLSEPAGINKLKNSTFFSQHKWKLDLFKEKKNTSI